MINQIHQLALNAYGEEQTSPLSLYQSLYENHPENFIMETQENTVLGYIIVCYLDEQEFQKTLLKGFKESDLDFNKEKNKTSNLYFFSIVVSPNSPKTTSLKLIKRLKKHLKEHQIKQISALIYSPEGERLANLLGLKEIEKSIYYLSL